MILLALTMSKVAALGRSFAQPRQLLSSRPATWIGRVSKSAPWGAIGLAIVLLVALGVRVVRLGTVPTNLTADEATSSRTSITFLPARARVRSASTGRLLPR